MIIEKIIGFLFIFGVLLVEALLIFGIPLLFILYSLHLIRDKEKRRKRCTEKVYAKVVDIEEEFCPGDDESSSRYIKHPVFGYTYCGNYYKSSNKYYIATSKKFRLDDEIEILVDPENPEIFYCNKGMLSLTIVATLIVCAAILLVIIFISTI